MPNAITARRNILEIPVGGTFRYEPDGPDYIRCPDSDDYPRVRPADGRFEVEVWEWSAVNVYPVRPASSASLATAERRWTAYAKLDGIAKDGECSAMGFKPGGMLAVVRPATTGGYAVLLVEGSRAKWLETLPTLDRARAYLAAVCR